MWSKWFDFRKKKWAVSVALVIVLSIISLWSVVLSRCVLSCENAVCTSNCYADAISSLTSVLFTFTRAVWDVLRCCCLAYSAETFKDVMGDPFVPLWASSGGSHGTGLMSVKTSGCRIGLGCGFFFSFCTKNRACFSQPQDLKSSN